MRREAVLPHLLDMQEQLLHALMTWQYPDASMEPAAVAALTRVRPAPAFMPQRKAAWVEAARCLLGAVRSSTCDAFYLISPAVRTARMPGSVLVCLL